MRKLPVIVTGIAALSFCLALTYLHPGYLRPLSRYATDAFLCNLTQPPRSNLVTIVDIDEASLSRHGQWPWPRTLLAQMQTELRRLGAGKKRSARPSLPASGKPSRPAAPLRSAQARMIRGLWIELGELGGIRDASDWSE